jgi:nucleoid-associated protein Lsr2
MARKIVVTVADDLDGSEANETVSFALDGVSYDIDLSSRNAEQFRRDLAPYIQHARQVKPASRRRGTTRSGLGRERSSEIRAWARQRGHKVSERGRVPISIIQQYETQRTRTYAAGPSPGPDFGDDE